MIHTKATFALCAGQICAERKAWCEMSREYGMEKCPYDDAELVKRVMRENGFGDDSGLCYDLDHFGNIVCGLCGANRERAHSAQENFLRGVERETRRGKENGMQDQATNGNVGSGTEQR